MKHRLSDTLTALVLLGLVGLPFARSIAQAEEKPVEAATRVEPDTVTVGTPFRYYISVDSHDQAEVVMPLLVDRIGDFLIRDFGESKPSADAPTRTERWYELVGYSAGLQLIAGSEIAYRLPGGGLEKMKVPDAAITIESLLTESEDGSPLELRDIVGPVGVPRPASPWWIVAALFVILLGAGYVLYRWYVGQQQGAVLAQQRPAHEVALKALVKLRSSRLLEEGRQPEYYVRLSAIIRDYVERRFQVRAPEMTTEEFLQAAQSNSDLPVEHRSLLADFLGEADLVKFARHLPTVAQGERACEAAREFIEKTALRAEVHDAAA